MTIQIQSTLMPIRKWSNRETIHKVDMMVKKFWKNSLLIKNQDINKKNLIN